MSYCMEMLAEKKVRELTQELEELYADVDRLIDTSYFDIEELEALQQIIQAKTNELENIKISFNFS